MKVFSLTKLGRKVTSSDTPGDPDEVRVLDYLRQNKTASDGELEVVGGEGWLMKRLKRQGLVTELTT